MTQQQINTSVVTDPPADGIGDSVINTSSVHNVASLVFDTSLVNDSADKFSVNPADAGLAEGDPFYLTTTAEMPDGLTANTIYYVVNATLTDFQVAATYQGAAIDILSQGSGYLRIHKNMAAVVGEPWDKVLERFNNLAIDSADTMPAMDAAVTASSADPFVTRSKMFDVLTQKRQFILIGPPGSGADYEGDTEVVFNEAIASLNGAAGQIYVSPASYTFASTVVVPSGVYLGAFTPATFIIADSSTAFSLSGTKAWLDGFNIAGAPATEPLVKILGTKNTLTKCYLHDFSYVGVQCGGSNSRIIGCKVESALGLGIILQGSYNVVEWCSFSGALDDFGAVKIEGSTCSVFGCTFALEMTGYAYYILSSSVYDTRMVANHFFSAESLRKSRDYGTRSVRYGNTPNTLLVNQNNFLEPLAKYVGQNSINTTEAVLDGAVLTLPIDGGAYSLPNDVVIIKCVDGSSTTVDLTVNVGDFEDGTKIFLYNTLAGTQVVVNNVVTLPNLPTDNYYLVIDEEAVNGFTVEITSDPYPVTVPLTFPFVITTNNLTELFGELDSWVQAQFEERNYFLYADLDVTYDTTDFGPLGNIIAGGSEAGGEVLANQMTWDGTTLTYPKFYVQSVLNRLGRWVVDADNVNLSAGEILYIDLDTSLVGDMTVLPTVGTYPLPLVDPLDTQRLVLAVCMEDSRLIWLSGFREIAGSSGAVEIPFVTVTPPHAGFIPYYTFTQSPATIDVGTNDILLDTTALGFTSPTEALFISDGTIPTGLVSSAPYYIDDLGTSFKVDTLSTLTEVSITAVNSGQMSVIVSSNGFSFFEWFAFVAGNTSVSYIDETLDTIFVTVGAPYTGHTFHDNLALFFYMYPPSGDFAGAMPAGIDATTKYYLVNTVQTQISPPKYNFQLATTPGGAPVVIVDKGSAPDYFVMQLAYEVRVGITFSGVGVDAESHLTFPATYGAPDYSGRMHVKNTLANKVREYTYYFDQAPPILNISNGVITSRLNDGLYRYAVEYLGASTGTITATLQVGFDTTYTLISPPLSLGDLWIVWDFKVENSTVTEVREMYQVLSSFSEADFHPDLIEYASTITIPFEGIPAGTAPFALSSIYTFAQSVSTLDASTDKILIDPSSLFLGDGDQVLTLSDDTMPTGMIAGVLYYLNSSTGTDFKLDDGSDPLNFTDVGSGNLSLIGNSSYVSSAAFFQNNTPSDPLYIDPANDKIGADSIATINFYGLYDNTSIFLTSKALDIFSDVIPPASAMPGGLDPVTRYYIVNSGPTGFQIADSIGGTPRTISSQGNTDGILYIFEATSLRIDLTWPGFPGNVLESHLTFPMVEESPNDGTRGNVYYVDNTLENTYYINVLASALPLQSITTSKLNDGIYRYSVRGDIGSSTATATLRVADSTYVLTSPALNPNDLWVVWDVKVENNVAVGIRVMDTVYPGVNYDLGGYYHPNEVETVIVATPTAGTAVFDVDGTPLPIARFVGAYETKNPPLPPSMFGGVTNASLTAKADAHSAQLRGLYDRTNMYLEPASVDAEINTEPTGDTYLSTLLTGLPGSVIPTHFLQDRTQTYGLVSFPVPSNGLYKWMGTTWTRVTGGPTGGFAAMSKCQQGIALLGTNGQVHLYDPDTGTWISRPVATATTAAVNAYAAVLRPTPFPVGGQIDYALQTEHNTYFKTNSGTTLRYWLDDNRLEAVPRVYTQAPGDAGLLSHSLKDTGYNTLRDPDTLWESLDNGVSFTTGLPTGNIRSKMLAGNDRVLAEIAATNFASLVVENFSIDENSGAWLAVYKTNTNPPTKWYILGGNDSVSYFYDIVLPSSDSFMLNFTPMQWLVDPRNQEVFVIGRNASNVFEIKKGSFASGVWSWASTTVGTVDNCLGCIGTFDHYPGGIGNGDIYVLCRRQSAQRVSLVRYTAATSTWALVSTLTVPNWQYVYFNGSNLEGYGAACPRGIGFLVTDVSRGNRPTSFFYTRSTSTFTMKTLGDTGADVTLSQATAGSAVSFYGAVYHSATNSVYYVARSAALDTVGVATLFAQHGGALSNWSALALESFGNTYVQSFLNRTGNCIAVDNNVSENKVYLLSDYGITTFTLNGFASYTTAATQRWFTTTGVPAFSMLGSPYVSQLGALRGGELNVLMGSWVKETFPVRFAGFGIDAGLGEGLFWTDYGHTVRNITEGIWAGINRNGYLWIADANKSQHPYEFKPTPGSIFLRGNVLVSFLGAITDYDFAYDATNNLIGFVFREVDNSQKLAFLLWDVVSANYTVYEKAFSVVTYNSGSALAARVRIAYSAFDNSWIVVAQNNSGTMDIHRRTGTWASFTNLGPASSVLTPSKPLVEANGDAIIASCDGSLRLYVHYFTPANSLVLSSGPSGFGYINSTLLKAGSTYWVAGSSSLAKSTSYTSAFTQISNPLQASYALASAVVGYAYSDRIVLASPLSPTQDEMGVFVYHNSGAAYGYSFAAKGRTQASFYSGKEESYVSSTSTLSFSYDGSSLVYQGQRAGQTGYHVSIRGTHNEWQSLGDSALGSGRLITIGDRCYREEFTETPTVTDIVYEYDYKHSLVRKWSGLPIAERDYGNFTVLRYPIAADVTGSRILLNGNPAAGLVPDTTSPIVSLPALSSRAFPYIGGQTRIQGGAGANVLYNGAMLFLAASYLPVMGVGGMLRLDARKTLTFKGSFTLKGSDNSYVLGPLSFVLDTPAITGKHLVLQWGVPASLALDSGSPLLYWTDLDYPQNNIGIVLGEVREKEFILYPVLSMHSEQIKLAHGSLEREDLSTDLPNLVYCAPASQYCINKTMQAPHETTSLATDSVSVREVGSVHGFQKLLFTSSLTLLSMSDKHFLLAKGLPPRGLGKYYFTGAEGSVIAGEGGSRIEPIVGENGLIVTY